MDWVEKKWMQNVTKMIEEIDKLEYLSCSSVGGWLSVSAWLLMAGKSNMARYSEFWVLTGQNASVLEKSGK